MNKILLFILILVSFSISAFAQVPQSQTLTISAIIPGDNPGGNGGGGYLIPTSVTFSGYAYPFSKVFLLKDGQLISETVSDINANFSFLLDNNLTTGNYLFSIMAEDSNGKFPSSYNIPLYITLHTATTISGIFLSPTITTNKLFVTVGNNIKISGQSAPNSNILIYLKENFSDAEIIKNTNSDSNGFYFLDFNTASLKNNYYQVKSMASRGNLISPFSQIIVFNVGLKDVLNQEENCNQKADLNNDCFVNLADFSILLSWHKKINFPIKIDLNNDGILNITDFSIMAYHWTG